jgi:dTDP-4-amino-4,6-dideoxygalactose transaminase
MNSNFKTALSRRRFLETTSLAGAGLSLGLPQLNSGREVSAAELGMDKPAALGGTPVCKGGWPGWPVFDQTEDKALMDTLHSGEWFRGSGHAVARFEEAYAKLTGAKHCLATSCGTSALYTVLGALDIGPGDEVILPPYTFVATYNVIVLNYALPIFVDSDLETFQIDSGKIAGAITDRTKAIIPVHLGGSAANLDQILDVAGARKIPVVEDACQAHLAEWRGRKVGTWGAAGCFSFQASKNLNSGEGGAVLTNNDELAEIFYNFHNQGRGRQATGYTFSYSGTRGSNLRLCEFQGSLLLAQMTRIEEQAKRRTENAQYLTKMLREIPGILPAKMYEGCTRNAYHLYMFRYQKELFANMDRAKFMKALQKEGVPCSSGYSPLNKDSYVRGLVKSAHYRRIYSAKELGEWEERNQCPKNEQLCQEALWFTQTMLLAPRTDMEKIAAAISRIQKHAADVAKA